MPRPRKEPKPAKSNSSAASLEAKLWAAADALRDALLPKLISGVIRVPDARRVAARAVW